MAATAVNVIGMPSGSKRRIAALQRSRVVALLWGVSHVKGFAWACNYIEARSTIRDGT